MLLPQLPYRLAHDLTGDALPAAVDRLALQSGHKLLL